MTKNKPRKTKKASNKIGLKANAYRAHTKYYVDSLFDGYVKDLPEKDQKWMNKFLREYYGTTFSSSRPLIGTGKKKKREMYREKNKREADITYRNSKIDSEAMRTYYNEISLYNNPENIIIDSIDFKEGYQETSVEGLTEEEVQAIFGETDE